MDGARGGEGFSYRLDIPFMVVISGLIAWAVYLPLGTMAIAAIYGRSLE